MSGTAQRLRLFNRQGGRCAYCFSEMTMELNRDNTATRDHIRPKSRGGPSSDFNLISSCRRCNSLKGDMPLLKFLQVMTGGLPHMHPMFNHPAIQL